MTLKDCVVQSADFIKENTPQSGDVGIILGTGLGSLADDVDERHVLSYENIPHFPKSTVRFHAGQLVTGKLSSRQVMVMQGRFHYYEGYPMQDITLPVRVMYQLGIRTLVITNAAGSIREKYPPGTLALIMDHINLMGGNPLIGTYDEFLGERFPDMTEPYDNGLRALAKKSAKSLNLELEETVYAAISGPSFETNAEVKMLRMFDVDTVGMSVVPEVLVARQLGMRVLALSVITDQSIPGQMEAISHIQVAQVANEKSDDFKNLIKAVIKQMN